MCASPSIPTIPAFFRSFGLPPASCRSADDFPPAVCGPFRFSGQWGWTLSAAGVAGLRILGTMSSPWRKSSGPACAFRSFGANVQAGARRPSFFEGRTIFAGERKPTWFASSPRSCRREDRRRRGGGAADAEIPMLPRPMGILLGDDERKARQTPGYFVHRTPSRVWPSCAGRDARRSRAFRRRERAA